MRIFFAGETSVEQSLQMLRAYRDKCLKSKEALKAAYVASSEYGLRVGDDKKSKFWDISILYGEAFFEASYHWAAKAITLLEGNSL